MALLQAEASRPEMDSRILTPVFAPLDQFLFEARFDSEDDLNKSWSNWEESGAGPAFRKNFEPLIHGEGRYDVWQIHQHAKAPPTGGKFVNWRITCLIPGHKAEVLDLLTKTRGDRNRYQILIPSQGSIYNIALVFEFDSVDVYLQEWADWASQKATPAFWETWNRGIDTNGENMVWQVA